MTTIDREYFAALPDKPASEWECKPIDADSIEAGLRDGFSRFMYLMWGVLVGMVLAFGVIACAAWGGGK